MFYITAAREIVGLGDEQNDPGFPDLKDPVPALIQPTTVSISPFFWLIGGFLLLKFVGVI